jgi:choline-glycine betaine transporter
VDFPHAWLLERKLPYFSNPYTHRVSIENLNVFSINKNFFLWGLSARHIYEIFSDYYSYVYAKMENLLCSNYANDDGLDE